MRDLKILHIEDNEADAFFIKEAFKSSKLKPTLQNFDDAEKAIDFLQQKGDFTNAAPPDLILLDLNMPRTDGFTVLEKVKNHPVLKRIPVIVLTNSSAPSDIQKSYDLHANSYVLKPMGLDEMTHTVTLIEDFWFGLSKLANPAL